MKHTITRITIVLLLLINIQQVLFSQTNIAPDADTILTSYVSSWENLFAINNGIDPSDSYDKTGGAYGNWNGQDNYNKWNWVEYDFDQHVAISRSDVYWWTDGQGISIPYESYLEYWDLASRNWKRVEVITGNGVLQDQYNISLFDTLLTNRIRIYFISNTAQGILEWKVYGEPGAQAIPYYTQYEIDSELSKEGTSHILVTAKDENSLPLPGYGYRLSVTIGNERTETGEIYSVNGLNYSSGTYTINMAPTDNQGETSFDISLPATIDPTDGVKLNLKYDQGAGSITSFSYYEPGFTPPLLNADVTENSVDNDLEITFTDNEDWRAHINKILVNDQELIAGDYSLEAGKLILHTSNGNTALEKSGSKDIVVFSSGYAESGVTQTILAGVASPARSTVEFLSGKLYRSSLNMGSVIARDKFGNPVQGYEFSYDVIINNTSGTSYEFRINDQLVNSNQENQILSPTNARGESKFWISLPNAISLNDGIRVDFHAAGESGTICTAEFVNDGTGKVAYLPNDLKNMSEFSWNKTAQTENFTAFWGDATGSNPLQPSDGGIAFNPYDVLNNLETYYKFYVDSMNFIPNADSGNMGKYKFVVIVFNTWKNSYKDNGAYGGSVDEVIGAMWMGPRSGFVVAHEFGHACQAMIPIQYPGKGIKNANDNSHIVGMFWEACANYMAYLAIGGNPNPIEFMNNSMMQYLTTNSMRHYDANYFPMYVIDQHGYDGFARLWRCAEKGDHPFVALGKGLGITPDEARDEAGKYAMHNVTWDYSMKDILRNIVKNASYTALPRVYTILDSIPGDGERLIVPRYMAPGDYGYNIIPLYPDEGKSEYKIRFHGFENDSAQGAEWRYGVVAVDENGEPRYSEVYSEKDLEASFTVEAGDRAFYLTVIATPTLGHSYAWTPGWTKVFRYPYSIEFVDVKPAGHKAGYNSLASEFPGAPHTYGGGWVASTATVDASVFVGPQAQVLGNARVSGNSRIEDFAIVRDNAQVSGNAIIRDNAIVGTSATVKDNAVVERTARVFAGNLSEDAVASGSAVLNNCTLSGNAVVKDLAWLNNEILSGTVVVGGDVVNISNCSEGIYLQIQRDACDKASYHALNLDVNPDILEYAYYDGEKPETPFSLQAGEITMNSVELSWSVNNTEDILEYIVLANGKQVGTSQGNSTVISGLVPNREYAFKVCSRNYMGTFSSKSNTVNVTTLNTNVTANMTPEGYTLFPNPSNSSIHIQLPGYNQVTARITDSAGRSVKEFIFSEELILTTSELGTPGIYNISFHLKDLIFTDRICIE